MLRDEIRKLTEKAIKELGFKVPKVLVEEPKEKEHGDYATSVALVIAKEVKKDPMEIAEIISSKLKSQISKPQLKTQKLRVCDKIEVVSPGFINFFLSKEYLQKQVGEILKKKEKFGNLKIGKDQKVNVEFISANPTGPLTLGNGRGGFCGDVLANVLKKAGYNVTREYYVNDRGKQIEDLRKGLYKGETRTVSQIQKENQKIIAKKLKIKFDVWFSEKSLYKNKEVDKILGWFKKKKLTYKKEGALWFKSTEFGDDKDRVLIKSDGEKTYFASDVAYLKNKFERGFKELILFIGADHYGYVGRMKAATEALGYKKEQIDFIVMQLVRLKQGRMSKRAGVYVALEELINQVGLDVTRFFFLQRAAGSHLNFDMDLARKKSQENPVYYIQYAYARICNILRKCKMQKGTSSACGRAKSKMTVKNSKLLNHPSELILIKQLIRLPEIIEDTAKDYQVQRLPQYALDLATVFHQFYRDCRVIGDDKNLTQARLSLIVATKIVLKNTLDLMGISAPEKM